MKISQPIKWHGGKSYLAQWIIERMPEHTRYCEPYFGGGAVLFQKPCDGVAEFVNDLHSQLVNFWRALQSPALFEDFRRIAETTPLSKPAWQDASLTCVGAGEYSPAFEAAAFFVRYRQSRQGLGRDFATPTSRLRRGMNEQVSAWLSAVDGLPEAHARLRRVEIRCMPAVDFIRELDSPDTLFYCDPPYLHETRSTTGEYLHEMSDEAHGELLECLSLINGKFLLSGYHSELYDDWASDCGWRLDEKIIDNKASGKRSKDKKTECLWMNYA